MVPLVKDHRVTKEVCSIVSSGELPFPGKSLKKKLVRWVQDGYPAYPSIECRPKLKPYFSRSCSKLTGHYEFYRWKLQKGYRAVLLVHKEVAAIMWLGPHAEYDELYIA